MVMVTPGKSVSGVWQRESSSCTGGEFCLYPAPCSESRPGHAQDIGGRKPKMRTPAAGIHSSTGGKQRERSLPRPTDVGFLFAPEAEAIEPAEGGIQ